MAKNVNRKVSVEQQAAQMKRSLTFFILILMVMSLTVCNTPNRELIENGTYLTLVNATHKVSDNWPDKIELVTAENSLGEQVQIEKETLAHFEDLRSELLEEGIDIELDSAYRSVEEQQEIWDEFSNRYGEDAGKMAAKPGYSEHHTGLAVDVFLIDEGTVIRDNDDLYAAEELFAKIHLHLAEHGFVVRVLPGKEEVCGGLSYKPWHFRYVGKTAAREMYAKGVVLEEYLGEIG